MLSSLGQRLNAEIEVVSVDQAEAEALTARLATLEAFRQANIERAQVLTDPTNPLLNRLIQGRYPPGSTFKVLMATAGLAEGIITPDFHVTCTGSKEFYGRVFMCDRKDGKGTAHGTLDVEHAIEKSCDVFFYTLASLMKIDTIRKYSDLLGLSGKTGIDLPNEIDSIVPSTEWKMKDAAAKHRPPSEGKWYPGETISVGIGQGQVSVTPLQIDLTHYAQMDAIQPLVRP